MIFLLPEAGFDLQRETGDARRLFVIGGGIEDCGAVLLDSIKTTVKEWSVEEASTQVKIIPSAFGENAVALGVVGIVAREIFAQA